MSFSSEELQRYSRQILVRDFGGQAQAKLKDAHIAVIGAGGIGAPLLLYLAAAGVGEITLFEDDEVTLSNLHRQVIYTHEDIGRPKILEVERALKARNPQLALHLRQRFDDQAEADGASLIVDGSDNLDTRQRANRKAAEWQVPLLAASLAQWEGQIAHFDPAHHRGCYECLYPEGTDASAIPSCSEAGVIGPVAGVLGTLAAVEVVKLIAGIKPLQAGEIFLFDGLYRESRTMSVQPRENCPICTQRKK